VISLGHFLPEIYRENKPYLFLDFDDETFGSISVDSEASKHAPTEGHVRQIIQFVRELSPVDKLLVHCFAGYSRSPAAVIIAKCERDGKTFYQAKEELYNARIPDKLHPCPNDIMVHNYLMIKSP
jgi:predicted protein tyrosine phosphatase